MAVATRAIHGGQALRVKPVRQWFGLSQEELASTLGVGRATVVRWEAGSGGPARHTAEGRLVSALIAIKSLATKTFGRQARAWLDGRAPTLGGATPRAALVTRGPIPVLTILQAHEDGGYL